MSAKSPATVRSCPLGFGSNSSEALSALHCGICRSVLFDPVYTSPCKHIFCRYDKRMSYVIRSKSSTVLHFSHAHGSNANRFAHYLQSVSPWASGTLFADIARPAFLLAKCQSKLGEFCLQYRTGHDVMVSELAGFASRELKCVQFVGRMWKGFHRPTKSEVHFHNFDMDAKILLAGNVK